MSAIWYRVRSDLKRRRGSVLVIALLLGLGGGAVMAAAAGARRTDSAYPRLLQHTSAAHLTLGVELGSGPHLTPEEAIRDPRVVAVKPYRFYLTLVGSPERCDQGACLLGLAEGASLGEPIDGMKLLRGRLADQSDPSEVVLTIVGAAELDLDVGDRFPLRGVPFGEFFEPFEQRAAQDPLTMHVVGVVATPGSFPPQIGDETVHARFTRAFYERYPEPSFGIDGAMSVRLRAGDADVAPFLEPVFARFTQTVPLLSASHDRNVQRSFHLQALALWALAAAAGLTILLIVAQALAREMLLGSDDNGTLAALGMTRSSVWVLGMIRAVLIAMLAAILAIPVAFLLSPLFPRGTPRLADPTPGYSADWLVFVVGAAVLLLLVPMAAAWPAVRAARVGGSRAPHAAGKARPSAVGELAARTGASPVIVTGTRMALEPGSGKRAVPVRTTLLAMTVGIGAVVAALSFGSSLDHLLATPRLYGVTFDMVVGSSSVRFSERADRLRAMPEIEGVAWGFEVGVIASDAPLSGIAMDTDDLALEPPLLRGRPPQPAEQLEAVLGSASARRLGVDVGDVFAFEVPDTGARMEARVVGIGALPTFEDSTALSDGVWFSHAGVERVLGSELPADKAFLRLTGGADETATFHRIANELGVPVDEDLWRPETGTPADLVSFGDARRLPLILALLIAVISMGMLAHAVSSLIKRRAREVAILKTLGFTSRQSRGAIYANATTLGIITAILGLPAGIVAGRLLWRGFANAQGIVVEPLVAWSAVGIAGVASVVLALLVAVMPARAAARTRPAVVLRSE